MAAHTKSNWAFFRECSEIIKSAFFQFISERVLKIASCEAGKERKYHRAPSSTADLPPVQHFSEVEKYLPSISTPTQGDTL